MIIIVARSRRSVNGSHYYLPRTLPRLWLWKGRKGRVNPKQSWTSESSVFQCFPLLAKRNRHHRGKNHRRLKPDRAPYLPNHSRSLPTLSIPQWEDWASLQMWIPPEAADVKQHIDCQPLTSSVKLDVSLTSLHLCCVGYKMGDDPYHVSKNCRDFWKKRLCLDNVCGQTWSELPHKC